jgi:hypothetical protein
MIQHINRGSAKGLEYLALIQPRDKNERGHGYQMPHETECRDAVKKVYELLMSVVSLEEQQNLPIDGILVEHILCKFSRCVSKGIVRL